MPKISQLPSLVAAVKGTDILHHVDPTEGTPVSRSVTADQLKTFMGGGGAGTVDGFVYGSAQQNLSVPDRTTSGGTAIIAGNGLNRGIAPDLPNGGLIVATTGLHKIEISLNTYITTFAGNNAVMRVEVQYNFQSFEILNMHIFGSGRRVSGYGSIVMNLAAGQLVQVSVGASVGTITSININDVMFRLEQL